MILAEHIMATKASCPMCLEIYTVIKEKLDAAGPSNNGQDIPESMPFYVTRDNDEDSTQAMGLSFVVSANYSKRRPEVGPLRPRVSFSVRWLQPDGEHEP